MPEASSTKDLGKFVSLNPAHSTQHTACVHPEISRQREIARGPLCIATTDVRGTAGRRPVRGSLPTLSLLQRSYPTSGFSVYTFSKLSTYSCVTPEKAKPGNRSGSSQQELVLV